MIYLAIYLVIVAVFYFVFRQIILENSNVSKLDFFSGGVVLLAALSMPNSVVWVIKNILNLVNG